MYDICKGAIGTKLRWTVVDNEEILDVSDASLMQLKLIKPNGVQVTKPLTHITDGTDGRVEYVVESGVLDTAGTYKWQLYLAISPWQDHSSKGHFVVGDILF
jgi:hypothetical protein